MKHLVVLTGAGISAESGISTFRDANGLWENHDIMEVASPEGFAKNPELVLRFYNQRRRQLSEVNPNAAHKQLAALESSYKIQIVTQNVDDLHERAGSTQVTHLHGELLKSKSSVDTHLIYTCTEDINLGDVCENGHQLRPHIVWFGEDVPEITNAIHLVEKADILVIIGTSMQVYPAAGLVNYAKPGTPIFLIDPNPAIQENYIDNLTIIAEKASTGVTRLIREYLN